MEKNAGFLPAALLGVGAAFAGEGPTSATRPNIVYIVVDNVTFEHMGQAYGGENATPAMDSIAERGVRFERMHVTSPLCVPSRYSILSGRYPERCTSKHFLSTNPPGESWYEVGQVELEPDRPNLPKALRSAGYATGFVGKFHNLHTSVGPDIKLEKPTHITDPELQPLLAARNDALAEHIRSCGFDWVGAPEYGNGYGLTNHEGMKFLEADGVKHNLEWEVQHALEFLDRQAGKREPFFLYFATQLYHLPFRIEKDLLMDYEKYGRYTERGLLDKAPAVPMPPRKEIAAIAERDTPGRRDAAGMRLLDFGVQAVLGRIRDLGIGKNTLVILLSDNNQEGKSTVYERGIRVPAAMMWPERIPAGQVNRRLLSSLDIVATLMDLAGAKEPAGMDLDGRSFLPIVTGQPDQPWDDVFMGQYAYGRGLVTPRWKYVAVRYPEERWEQIRAEEAKNPDAPDFGRNPTPAQKWRQRVKPNLHPAQVPHAYNIYRYWHSRDQNHMSRVANYPHIFDLDQLYDLDADPEEQVNLAGNPEYTAVLAEMKELLAREVSKMDRPFGEFNRKETEK